MLGWTVYRAWRFCVWLLIRPINLSGLRKRTFLDTRSKVLESSLYVIVCRARRFIGIPIKVLFGIAEHNPSIILQEFTLKLMTAYIKIGVLLAYQFSYFIYLSLIQNPRVYRAILATHYTVISRLVFVCALWSCGRGIASIDTSRRPSVFSLLLEPVCDFSR